MHICKSEKYWENDLKTANGEKKGVWGEAPKEVFANHAPQTLESIGNTFWAYMLFQYFLRWVSIWVVCHASILSVVSQYIQKFNYLRDFL